jgi:hypothetical protein
MDWSFSLLNHPTFFEWLTRPSQQQIRTFPREPGWFYKTTGEPSIAYKSLGQIFDPFSATTVMYMYVYMYIYIYLYIYTDVHRYKHAVFGPIVLGPEHFGARGFARSPTFGPLSQGKREHRPLGTGIVTVRFFFFPLKIGGFLQLGVRIQPKWPKAPRVHVQISHAFPSWVYCLLPPFGRGLARQDSIQSTVGMLSYTESDSSNKKVHHFEP